MVALPHGNNGNGDQSVIESGRNALGQFASKQAIQQAAIRLQQQYQQAIGKSGEKIQAVNAKLQEQRKIQRDLFASYRKHFDKQQKAFDKGQRQRQKQQDKQVKAQVKQIQSLAKMQTKARKSEIAEMRKQFRTQTQIMRRQVADYRKLAREKIRAARAGASRSGGLRGGLGLGVGLGIGAGVTGLAYGAYARTKALVNDQLKAALSLGPDIVARIRGQLPPGLAESQALRAVGAVAATGPQARFGMDDKMLGVLLDLRGQLKSFGSLADEMLADVVKSFGMETDRMRAFFSTAQQQGIRSALSQYVTPSQADEFTTLRNALQIRELQGQGQLDPLLQAAMEVKEAFAELDAQIDKLIMQLAQEFGPALADLVKKIAEFVGRVDLSKIDLKKWAMIAGGGYLGLKLAPALLRGGGKLLPAAGRGAGALLANPIGAGVAIGVGSSLAIDELGYNPFGADKQRRAGNYGYGAVSWYKHSKDMQAEQEQRGKALAAQYAQQAATAKTELARVKALRDQLTSEIGAIPNAWGGGYSDDNRVKLERLQAQRESYNRRYLELKKQHDEIAQAAEAAERKENSLWNKIKRGAAAASEKVKQYAQQVKAAKEAEAFRQAQDRAREAEQIRARAGLAGTETDIARARYEYARMSVFGTIGAIPELNDLNDTLEKEIGKLRKVQESIDQSTTEGLTEWNRIEGQILRLRTEQKRNFIDLDRALIEGVVGQAFGASGSFQKIIVNHERNLGKALYKGLINPDVSPRVGRVPVPGDMLRMPVRIQDLLPSELRYYNDQSSALNMPSYSRSAEVLQRAETQEAEEKKARLRSKVDGHKASADTIASGADKIAQDLSAWGREVSGMVVNEDFPRSTYPKRPRTL